MALFRWALLLAGLCFIGGIFAYSRGWLTFNLRRLRRRNSIGDDDVASVAEHVSAVLPEPAAPVRPKPPALPPDSKVVSVRIMPQQSSGFPAEQLVLILRGAGLQHGKYGIFHNMDTTGLQRIRFSVASLVEPGSFDLSKLKDSSYKGVSIFMVLPAPEDGVALFDEMLDTARMISRGVNGRLVDEDGNALSVQRERYMREEVIDFVRRHAELPGLAD